MSGVNILPNSLLREPRVITRKDGTRWMQLYCANCGREGGLAQQTEWDAVRNFASYLCEPCGVKWAPLTNTWLVPDEVFWQKVKEAQLEHYGRELTATEVAIQLRDGNSLLSKLARERFIQGGM